MRATITITSLALVLGIAATAHAGGYVALGVGSDASLDGAVGDAYTADGSDNARLSFGQRTGPIAIEASLFGTGLQDAAGTDHSTLALGVDLKYFIRLTGPIEGYGRIGLNKTWLRDSAGDQPSLSGRGYDFGGGLQYSFRLLPLGDAAIWVDFTHQTMSLYGDATSAQTALTGSAEMLTLGVSVGF